MKNDKKLAPIMAPEPEPIAQLDEEVWFADAFGDLDLKKRGIGKAPKIALDLVPCYEATLVPAAQEKVPLLEEPEGNEYIALPGQQPVAVLVRECLRARREDFPEGADKDTIAKIATKNADTKDNLDSALALYGLDGSRRLTIGRQQFTFFRSNDGAEYLSPGRIDVLAHRVFGGPWDRLQSSALNEKGKAERLTFKAKNGVITIAPPTFIGATKEEAMASLKGFYRPAPKK